MKSSYWIAVAVLLMSCTRNDVSPVPDTTTSVNEAANGQTTELKLQQIQALAGLTVQLQKVEDSRCPMNAMCIRQGSAIATIQAQDTNGHSVTQRLYLGETLATPDNRGARSADTVAVTLGQKSYELILSDVQPYPNTSDATPPAKTVKVTVRSL